MIELRRGDPRYPPRLEDLRRPPDPLWLSGQLVDWSLPAVAIVGTRRMTPYGARVAREIATLLARAGAVVVSGLAQGIDSQAHAATVDAGGTTVAVLGEGLAAFDSCGPIRRRRLAARIQERGAILSEYDLDRRAESWTFPRRNWTIAALAQVTVVVEAPQASGALITASAARALDRAVYAVPGPLGAGTWVGANRLIAHAGARLLCDPVGVLEALGIGSVSSGAPASSPADLVLEALAAEPLGLDDVGARLGLRASVAAGVIAELMILGRIRPTGDGRFARV